MRRADRIRVLLGIVVLTSWGLGCSDPDKVILASMSDVDRARFESGRRVAVPCWTCHDLAGHVKKVGPSLLGVYGRASGRAPDYSASPAMLGAMIVWDDRSLSAFLSNPSAFVPGNRMVSPGVGDPASLRDLLFYLRHVTRPGARDSPAS